jgi:hypothetical protein
VIGSGVLALPPSADLQAVAVAVHLEDVDVEGRLLVSSTEPRSSRRLKTSNSNSAPVVDSSA